MNLSVFENDSGLGSIWDDLVGSGVSVGTGFLNSLLHGGGSTGGQAKGSAAIRQYGQNVIAALSQIIQLTQSGQLSPADAIANAQRIVASLSDSTYVYQAKHGDDASILQNAKAQANQMLQQIQALANVAGASSLVVSQTSPAGLPTQTTVAASPAGSFQIDPTLLLIGGGLLVLLLLK